MSILRNIIHGLIEKPHQHSVQDLYQSHHLWWLHLWLLVPWTRHPQKYALIIQDHVDIAYWLTMIVISKISHIWYYHIIRYVKCKCVLFLLKMNRIKHIYTNLRTEHYCYKKLIMYKQMKSALTTSTSSAANFKTAVNGVCSGTLSLQINRALTVVINW